MDTSKIRKRRGNIPHDDLLKMVAMVRKIATEGEHYMLPFFDDAKALESLNYLNCRDCITAWYEKDTTKILGAVAYTITEEDWYTNARGLVEIFVLKLSDDFHGLQRLAIEELQKVAEEYNCKLIHCGDYLSPPKDKTMVGNAYRKTGGFKGHYNCYMKILSEE